MLRKLISKRTVMAISLVLLSLTAMSLTLIPRPAKADEAAPFKGTPTVQFEVITTLGGCALGDAACNNCVSKSGDFIEAQGIGETSLGPMFVLVLKCFDPAGGLFGTYQGTLKTTAPNGKDSLTWDYSGQNDNAGDFYGFGPFSGNLKVTGGTGKFEGAKGGASFTAVSGPNTVGPSPNTFVGMAFYFVQGKIEMHDDD
jgi:hypothetical protein